MLPPDRTVTTPAMLGLFGKRIEGDDSLLELARLRFRQAGLGTEIHGGTPEPLEHLLRFRPEPNAPAVVHLPRDFSLSDPGCHDRIVELASRFAGRVYGLLLHDQPELQSQAAQYRRVAEQVDSRLSAIAGSPLLFIEYASGLEPNAFSGFFESIRELRRVSACVDTGHVGIRQARQAFAREHPGQDVCALKSQPAGLRELMTDIDQAVASALPVVLELVAELGACGKPVHFHLHDGHPLSTFSPFGVSDHLSFFAAIPLRFPHRGRRAVSPMFGPSGLAAIMAQAVNSVGTERLSLTLEIHPTFEQAPLGDAAALFGHWADKTNAEKMNHWLELLSRNRALLAEALATAVSPAAARRNPSLDRGAGMA